MRTITLILVLATLAVLIIYGLVVAAGGALGQPSQPPESTPTGPGKVDLPPPPCAWRGQVIGDHVQLWVDDADPKEALFCWLLTPEGRLLSGTDRWPIVIPARLGDWVLVVRRPDCRVCVHPFTITPAEELESTRGEVN